MKKSPKKLVLAKETLRQLEEAALGKALGGEDSVLTTCAVGGCRIPCFEPGSRFC